MKSDKHKSKIFVDKNKIGFSCRGKHLIQAVSTAVDGIYRYIQHNPQFKKLLMKRGYRVEQAAW